MYTHVFLAVPEKEKKKRNKMKIKGKGLCYAKFLSFFISIAALKGEKMDKETAALLVRFFLLLNRIPKGPSAMAVLSSYQIAFGFL